MPLSRQLLGLVAGWTLPGVVTAGGVTALVKAQRVLPGRRVLLAGTGPLLLAAATALAHGGARIVGIAEAAPRRALLGLLRRPGIVGQALEVMRALWRADLAAPRPRSDRGRRGGRAGGRRAARRLGDRSPARSVRSTSTRSSSATAWSPRPSWRTSPAAPSHTTPAGRLDPGRRSRAPYGRLHAACLHCCSTVCKLAYSTSGKLGRAYKAPLNEVSFLPQQLLGVCS
jgi:hypothetical protein